MKGKIFKGEVISRKMSKTVVVRVFMSKIHKKYGKGYTSTKNFKVHVEDDSIVEGDIVRIVETRPISKTKCWMIITENSKKTPKIKKAVKEASNGTKR